MSVPKVYTLAMALAGALAGLAATMQRARPAATR